MLTEKFENAKQMGEALGILFETVKNLDDEERIAKMIAFLQDLSDIYQEELDDINKLIG